MSTATTAIRVGSPIRIDRHSVQRSRPTLSASSIETLEGAVLYVAVVDRPSDGFRSRRQYGDYSAFVGENRDEVIQRALRAREDWGREMRAGAPVGPDRSARPPRPGQGRRRAQAGRSSGSEARAVAFSTISVSSILGTGTPF